MAKPSITTRAGKGSPLTWAEGDANFTGLQSASVPDGGTTGQILAKNSNTNYDYAWITASSLQGIQGVQGIQGLTGITGNQGIQGIQGIGGNTGNQGIQGIQGVSGGIGSPGPSGGIGNTGSQGVQGTTGEQGIQGITGEQGVQGIQGTIGITGNQGLQGITGEQGIQGQQGTTGITGNQGLQGITGEQGIQGITGEQGIQGVQGIQGQQGQQGQQGIQGPQGTQGITGQAGQSNSIYNYQARTNIQTGNPGNGNIIWNNVTQASATELNFSHIDGNNDDIEYLLALILPNDIIRLQDQNNSTQYQVWTVSGSVTVVPNSYVTIPVTLVSSTFSFTNTEQIIAIIRTSGVVGAQGIQGIQGHQGIQGQQGIQGIQGITGQQGIQGIQGYQGYSSNIFDYVIDTTADSGDPGQGKIRYNAGNGQTRTPKTVTVNGNARVSTTQSKFGGASAVFDGTGDSLELNSSEFNFGTNDFTIECWVNLNDAASDRGIWTTGPASGFAPGCVGLICSNPSFGIGLVIYENDFGTRTLKDPNLTITGTWQHYAVVRSGTTFTLYKDGVNVSTATYAGSINLNNTKLYIGDLAWGLNNGNYGLNGYVDEFRISNVARYTSNFSVFTQAYSNDANTLLLLHMDGTNNSTNFVDEVDGTSQITSTALFVSKTTSVGQVATNYLKFLKLGAKFVIEDKNANGNYQVWRMTGAVGDLGSYYRLPATIVESQGTGGNNFLNLLAVNLGIDTGTQGVQGVQGIQGLAGGQGIQGVSGPNTTVSQSQPGVFSVGDQWFNPATQVLKVYAESGWVQVTADDLTF